MKVRPRSSDCDPENLRDLRVVVPFEVVHHDCRSLSFRKLPERVEHPLPCMSPLEFTMRIVPRRRRVRQFRMRPQKLTPPEVQARAPQHAIEPRTETASRPQLPDPLERANERGLYRVFRVLLVAQNRQRHRVGRVRVSRHEQGKRPRIAGLHGLHEAGLVRAGIRRLHRSGAGAGRVAGRSVTRSRFLRQRHPHRLGNTPSMPAVAPAPGGVCPGACSFTVAVASSAP